jgi:quinol monooxygenase YgiN
MILSVIKIFPSPGRGGAIIDVLDSLTGPVSALAGCLGCTLAVEAGEDEVISYTEKWSSRDALDRHLNSGLYGRVLEAMECSCRPPEVEFLEVTDVAGLEMVERVRKPH